MKRTLLLLVIALMINLSFADNLVKINYQSLKELKSLHANPALKINYSVDQFVIATVHEEYQGDYQTIIENCWTSNQYYYIAWFHKGVKGNYVSQISEIA